MICPKCASQNIRAVSEIHTKIRTFKNKPGVNWFSDLWDKCCCDNIGSCGNCDLSGGCSNMDVSNCASAGCSNMDFSGCASSGCSNMSFSGCVSSGSKLSSGIRTAFLWACDNCGRRFKQ